MEKSEYKIIVKDNLGASSVIITDLLWVKCFRAINTMATLDFAIDLDDPAYEYIQFNDIIELWRKNESMEMPWRLEFRGLCRGGEFKSMGGSPRQVVVVHCVGSLWLLTTRIIAYDDAVEGFSLWTAYAPAIVARSVVRYNCTSLATPSRGRYKTGEILGLSVEADKGETGSWVFAANYETVYDFVRYLADVEDEIFDLTYVEPGQWLFEYWNHDNPFGNDLTDTVKFSLSLDNMETPNLSYDRRKEKTVAIVFGPPLMGGGHDTYVVYGPDWSSVNDLEISLESDGERLNLFPRGRALLALLRARKRFQFQVIQQPGCYFGKHYDLGDRVSARYEGEEIVLRINSVRFTLGGMGMTSLQPFPEPLERQERIEIRCHQLS